MLKELYTRYAQSTLRPVTRYARQKLIPGLIQTTCKSHIADAQRIRVVGLLSSPTGLGKSARLCVTALESDGRTVYAKDVAWIALWDSPIEVELPPDVKGRFDGVTIYHLNPPMLAQGVLASGLGRHRSSFNIGYWAWEIEKLPPEWIRALRLVDAVFVPSSFTKEAVQRYTDKPVVVVPHPVELPAGVRPIRDRLGVAEGTFLVSSIFSFSSDYERKNPEASILAFKQAFGDRPDALLVLKTTHAGLFPAQRQRMLDAVGGAHNIRILDEIWPDQDLFGLLASSDVYISLHRSEGFGLTIAEAILAGTPTVVTNWSGNRDFCREGTSGLVDVRFVPASKGYAEAVTGEVSWADPDIPHAASWLRRLREDADLGKRLAHSAKVELTDFLRRNSYAAALDRLRKGGGLAKDVDAGADHLARFRAGREARTPG